MFRSLLLAAVLASLGCSGSKERDSLIECEILACKNDMEATQRAFWSDMAKGMRLGFSKILPESSIQRDAQSAFDAHISRYTKKYRTIQEYPEPVAKAFRQFEAESFDATKARLEVARRAVSEKLKTVSTADAKIQVLIDEAAEARKSIDKLIDAKAESFRIAAR